MEIIRGLSGFGDTLYLKAAVEYFFPNKDIIVSTNYPELFPDYSTLPFDRNLLVKYDFSYLNERKKQRKEITTNQWEDMLDNAKLSRIDFNLKHKDYRLNTIKPEVLVIEIYPSFGHGKGDPGKMMPSSKQYKEIIKDFAEDYVITYLSTAKLSYDKLCEAFLTADRVLCQQGWGTALAEGLNVPVHAVFTYEAMACDDPIIAGATPRKIFTKDTSKAIII